MITTAAATPTQQSPFTQSKHAYERAPEARGGPRPPEVENGIKETNTLQYLAGKVNEHTVATGRREQCVTVAVGWSYGLPPGRPCLVPEISCDGRRQDGRRGAVNPTVISTLEPAAPLVPDRPLRRASAVPQPKTIGRCRRSSHPVAWPKMPQSNSALELKSLP